MSTNAELLRAELSLALERTEAAESAFIRAGASTEAEQTMHTARGHAIGISRAMEALDDNPDDPDSALTALAASAAEDSARAETLAGSDTPTIGAIQLVWQARGTQLGIARALELLEL